MLQLGISSKQQIRLGALPWSLKRKDRTIAEPKHGFAVCAVFSGWYGNVDAPRTQNELMPEFGEPLDYTRNRYAREPYLRNRPI
jgi:hypothetical protein